MVPQKPLPYCGSTCTSVVLNPGHAGSWPARTSNGWGSLVGWSQQDTARPYAKHAVQEEGCVAVDKPDSRLPVKFKKQPWAGGHETAQSAGIVPAEGGRQSWVGEA